LVAIEVLRAVERITGKKTCDLFDYICGVSTGSILAFLLGAHKKSLDEAELLYKDLSKEIFSQNSFFGNAALLWSHSYYHTPTFERILKKHCGEVPLISLARDPQLPRVRFYFATDSAFELKIPTLIQPLSIYILSGISNFDGGQSRESFPVCIPYIYPSTNYACKIYWWMQISYVGSSTSVCCGSNLFRGIQIRKLPSSSKGHNDNLAIKYMKF